jgi:zinc protease
MRRRLLLKHFRAVILVLALLAAACAPLSPDAAPPGATIPPTSADAADTWELDETLPIDPNVRIGQLENGLTYYVRANQEPENRAELRLVVNAGSVLEDEDQRGLAHFLEHMLFNGTERFPEQELVEFFESIGMGFGPDVNAYTSFDETVYQLRIPTDEPELVQKGFDVLEDWAAYATIAPEEVDKERGVIVEEWRLRDQNANGRIQTQLINALFGDSRYAERRPIGDIEVIRNAPTEALTRFYETWYRPELMAIVAVGDFDAAAIEEQIREQFADLAPAPDAEARPTFDVPLEADTGYLILSDPEIPTTQLQVFYKTEPQRGDTVADYRNLLVTALFNNLLNFRLSEISRQADAPWLSASGGRGSFVRPVDVYFVGAQVEDEGITTGLDALGTEVERLLRHGFTEAELTRAKLEVLRNYESAFNERETTDSSSYVREYVGNYLEDEVIPGIEVEYELAQQLLPAITVEDVNAEAAALADAENRTVVVIAPEKEDLTLPSEDDLAAVLEDVQAKEIEPYASVAADAELMPTTPEPAAIISETTNETLGTTEIELENGVRVIMKPTDFSSDEVLFTATSPGGSSLVSEADYPEADTIDEVVADSGVGDFNKTELLTLLAGQQVAVTPQISELTEGFSGSASPQDLETLFQLIHLYVTEPRADEDAFTALQNQLRASLVNRELTPTSALQDAVFEALYGDTVRRGPLPLEEVEALDLARGMEIYRDRFGDVSDFTFIFVGAFDVAELTDLAQTYLGTLPGTDRNETWRDVLADPPAGVIEEEVFKGQDPQSIVQLIFAGPMDPTPENRLTLQLLETVLDTRVREELREERGGVYSAGVFASARKDPDPIYLFNVAFGTDPERAQELIDAVFAIVDEIQMEGPSPEDVANAKEQERRTREEELQENDFWRFALEYYVENPDEDPANILNLDERLEAVSVEDVQQAAQEYLLDDRYIQVVLYPEGFEPAE